MADAREATVRAAAGLAEAWRRWNFEQRTAAIGSVLLIASTFGPFSMVEAGTILTAGGVLFLLKARADHKRFHLPLGDGTAIFAAGCWSAFLIVVRLFDRPLGQNLLALVCAAILILAGARERQKRPPDDLPPEPVPEPTEPPLGPAEPSEPREEQLELSEPPEEQLELSEPSVEAPGQSPEPPAEPAKPPKPPEPPAEPEAPRAS